MSTAGSGTGPKKRPEPNTTVESNFEKDLPETSILFNHFNDNKPEAGKQWGNDPENWPQFKENDFQIKDVARISSQRTEQTLMGDDVINFDLVFKSNGQSAEVNVTRKQNNKGGGDGPSGGGSLAFELDMSKINDEPTARAALTAFNNMVLQTLLKYHPAGTPLVLAGNEKDPRWAKLAQELMIKQLKDFEPAFAARGITVELKFGNEVDIKTSLDSTQTNKSAQQDQGPTSILSRQKKPRPVPPGGIT